MEILVAKGAGFCSGVNRALDKTIQAVQTDTSRDIQVFTLGPIVHNKEVIQNLTEKGIGIIENLTQLQSKKCLSEETNNYVVIRSHGVGPETFKMLNNLSNTDVIDATCPFVRKVQQKASKLYQDGYQIFIVGDPNHPEVKGIKEWTDNNAIVIEKPEQVNDIEISNKTAVVAQTTLREEKFNEIVEKILDRNPNTIVHNTICDATQKRQTATKELAGQVDVMIVVGGYNSSNTKKLKELAVKEGVPTYHIETAKELKTDWFLGCKKIGVTAGASTPDWTIKEVVGKMREFEEQNENLNTNSDESTQESQDELMKATEDSADKLDRGQVVKGKVVKVTEDEAMIDVGYKFEGSVPVNEMPIKEGESLEDLLSEGDEIDVKVVKVDDEEGQLILSKKWADKDKQWEQLEQLMENDEEIKAQVTEEVKGGLVVDLGQLQGFIPASHVDIHYVPDLSKYVGEELRLKPIELDRSRNKIVLSQKNILEQEQEEKKNKTMETITEGDIVDGTVKRLTDFGAFIDIGGIDGLCHISQISHSRIDHPESELETGENVKVKVLSLDPENERISLSIKEAQPDPFETFMKQYKSGDIVQGKVVRTVNFGAFIEITPGVEGLCHISQLSDDHVAKTQDVVNEGDQVTVKILSIDDQQKKVSLSIKEAQGKSKKEQEQEEFAKYQDSQEEEEGVKLGDMFGDVLEEIKEDDKDDKSK
ncbi:bifunctional 4-hydroxy-3-methylbut-2-enyl diphosphate reductase/30S ribosomal protein S1 [Natranaerobius thermophilus]|uniref:4-hydroxy-3-methylbut-2-enyl diphosphate reductase n=1 Tax=Natranaerobius thermophilus (strain ATCC BAA-1301 / DSM 18059 / JW/NM-WN-LF) TaxID=457570 RepID=B2A4N7_NATTJ|nr:bifunctional 4-hydroxy-3-methylbut-2-enyl diphosphate reductase/30S ribosomal protein S1 [Natranaerobius thermophilus]ACB85212.1 hydroxymethylbutenyl pyrophosphate reductase [Natranaerobius thermophilus JW/NM-WN-LF]